VVNLTKNPYEIIRIGNISVEDIKKTLSKWVFLCILSWIW
jgi:tRNA A37 threonylcarbamoyladenosine synthetase subunit TsaC/SUA5/YrdC